MFKFFTKALGSFIVLLTLSLSLPLSLSAQSSDLLFGQNHSYSATFKGNGEAIVYAHLVFTNNTDKPMTEFAFEVPKAQVTELVGFQQILHTRCSRYDPTNSSNCLEYNDPDYSDTYYQGADYKKVSFVNSGNVYTLTLPQAVDPEKSGAIIISYAAKGYVTQQSGLYSFDFQTLKVNSRVKSVRVAVNVDSDLYLKGDNSKVNYSSGTSVAPMGVINSTGSVSNSALDKLSGQIGYYNGGVYKEGKDLSPGDTFEVKGEYSTSQWLLYLKQIIIGVIVVVAILLGLYFVSRMLRRKSEVSTGSSSFEFINFPNLSAGFISAIIVFVLLMGSRFLPPEVLSFFNYNNPLMPVIAILVFVLAMFGPAVLASTSRGVKALVYVLLAELLWLILFYVLYVILTQSLVSPITRPYPPVMY